MLPDIESLHCFEAAARRLSFTAAAREVVLSPSAFTDRIHRLEELLGVQLFQRNARHVKLTAAGVRLVPRARRALEEAVRCFDAVRDHPEEVSLELTIGCYYEVGLNWLLPLMPTLTRNHPGRLLHLHFGESPDLFRSVREGSIDAAITSSRVTDPSFEHAVLREVEFAFVASPALIGQHPLSNAAQASQHTLLDARADLHLFRYFLDAQRKPESWHFRAVQRLGTAAAIRHRVLDGAGVAVLPTVLVGADLRRGRLVRLFPEVALNTDQFRLVWSSGHIREAAIRELAGELAREFAPLGRGSRADATP